MRSMDAQLSLKEKEKKKYKHIRFRLVGTLFISLFLEYFKYICIKYDIMNITKLIIHPLNDEYELQNFMTNRSVCVCVR